MLEATLRPRSRKPHSTSARIIKEFAKTYADAVISDMTDEQWQKAARIRRLTRHSPHRMSLADAVKCYGQMAGGYNEFHPDLLRALHEVFAKDGITVTPDREYSVAVYLHVPDVGDLRKRVETHAREHFNADDVDWTEPDTLRCWWD